MKAVILITIFFLPLVVGAQTLKNLRQSTDSSYGFTLTNPIVINEGSTRASEVAVYNYLKGIRRLNGETLKVLSRTSVTNPNVKPNEQKEKLERMKKGEQVSILTDVYKLETLIKKDTLTLYIDMYGKGSPKVPVGYEWRE